MRFYTVAILSIFLFACKAPNPATTGTPKKGATPFLVKVHLTGCGEQDPISLYEFDGVGFKKLAPATIIGKDSFQFSFAPTAQPRFFYVGQETKQKMPLLAGTEKNVMLSGKCDNLRQTTTFMNSQLNDSYGQVIKDISKFNSERQQSGRKFQQAMKNPESIQKAIESMAAIDQRQLAYYDTLKVKDPYLARVVALTVYPSFQNNQGNYNNEIDYFADQYFQFADLAHPDYDQIPYLFESTKNYATVLSMQPLPKEVFHQKLDDILAKFNPDGRALKYALGGMSLGLQQKNHPSFVTYGNKFLEKYGAEESPMITNFRMAVERASSFMTGAVAPDFAQNDPEGKEIKLSDLRGKVVLVDFWASWCGPCRRENPNVVRMYNKYKDQGFEIIGVSLDRKKEPWLKAIEKDQLSWYHVSDLRGWQNAAAQMYSVTSVPHTVLLDREGRIVERNLRGAALEAKVAQIIKQ